MTRLPDYQKLCSLTMRLAGDDDFDEIAFPEIHAQGAADLVSQYGGMEYRCFALVLRGFGFR